MILYSHNDDVVCWSGDQSADAGRAVRHSHTEVPRAALVCRQADADDVPLGTRTHRLHSGEPPGGAGCLTTARGQRPITVRETRPPAFQGPRCDHAIIDFYSVLIGWDGGGMGWG